MNSRSSSDVSSEALAKGEAGAHQNRSGFTLIELSITLVIIGLIAGGLLVGRDMVHAARLRSAAAQIQEFEIAIRQFKYKYNCLPGDCTTASQLFSGAINGNGDYAIGFYRADQADNPKAWQHLSLAGLIGGAYTGIMVNDAPANVIVGTNTPPNKFSTADKSSWMFHRNGTPCNSSSEKNRILSIWDRTPVGAAMVGVGGEGQIAGLDVASVDKKIDDGKPSSGRMLSGLCVSGNLYSTSSTCTTAVCLDIIE